ncbi:heparan-alpha-glucosaminide N-acetyltransferase domain-containing protein [Pseudoalteromonas sp. B193]
MDKYRLCAGEKEQGRLLIDTLNSAFERAHSLNLASADHTTHCHQQLHNLISNHFNLNTPFKLTADRLTCCRYYLAGYKNAKPALKRILKPMNTRLKTIDLARGASVFIMILVHTLWMYSSTTLQSESLFGAVIHILGKGTASFLVAMGLSMALSRRQTPCY